MVSHLGFPATRRNICAGEALVFHKFFRRAVRPAFTE